MNQVKHVGFPHDERNAQLILNKTNNSNSGNGGKPKACNFVSNVAKIERECDQIVWEYKPEKLVPVPCASKSQSQAQLAHSPHAGYIQYKHGYLWVPPDFYTMLDNCQARYVIIRLTIILYSKQYHSSMLLFDSQYLQLFRFESYGTQIENGHKTAQARDRGASYRELTSLLARVFSQYEQVPSEVTSLDYGIQYWQEQDPEWLASVQRDKRDNGQDKQLSVASVDDRFGSLGYCSIWSVWLVSMFIEANGDIEQYTHALVSFIQSMIKNDSLTNYIESLAEHIYHSAGTM